MLKRTPLFETHRKLGGKLIEFGGWEMPVYYSSIMEEHQAVRTAAGLFDISHMGEVIVAGPQAESVLNGVLTNDLRKLAVGQGHYTLMCNEQGGVIDDLYAYRMNPTDFLLIINAARIEPDVAWLERCNAGRATLKNASAEYGALALQGPKSAAIIDPAFPSASCGGTLVPRASDLQKNQAGIFLHDYVTIYIARTGYTGEDGFEVVVPADHVESAWSRLMEAGWSHGLKPCGLGARDTLRTEVCYPLYGHELDEQTTPIEAGVGFFVALDKGEFTGRKVLARQKAEGVSKRCVAFRMTAKSAPPRPGYPIWNIGPDARRIGQVVSGTQSPSLGVGIGLGYVEPGFAKADTAIEIEIRGRRSPAVVVKKPIYRIKNVTV
ncbi:MAG: glycine cleavage system aminomethyltransferase GcvT [Verrucomicrobia bacterium]|jgi:aminomethyltransferase|nr:glycine cleavage system aminomethyltransferase GcvT [Verrucomicrobiota bacterium]